MPKLRTLGLMGAPIGDDALEAIASMSALRVLNVLKPLSKLTKLNLTGTAVTDQGLKDAIKFLPFWATLTR